MTSRLYISIRAHNVPHRDDDSCLTMGCRILLAERDCFFNCYVSYCLFSDIFSSESRATIVLLFCHEKREWTRTSSREFNAWSSWISIVNAIDLSQGIIRKFLTRNSRMKIQLDESSIEFYFNTVRKLCVCVCSCKFIFLRTGVIYKCNYLCKYCNGYGLFCIFFFLFLKLEWAGIAKKKERIESRYDEINERN